MSGIKASPWRITSASLLILTCDTGIPFSLANALFASAIAEIKDHQIAHVVSATALNGEQISRLTKSLTKIFGREIKVNASVKREVVGGMSIRVADELIDGTLLTRISQADRLLAGKNA